jgi:hypothetical protein
MKDIAGGGEADRNDCLGDGHGARGVQAVGNEPSVLDCAWPDGAGGDWVCFGVASDGIGTGVLEVGYSFSTARIGVLVICAKRAVEGEYLAELLARSGG